VQPAASIVFLCQPSAADGLDRVVDVALERPETRSDIVVQESWIPNAEKGSGSQRPSARRRRRRERDRFRQLCYSAATRRLQGVDLFHLGRLALHDRCLVTIPNYRMHVVLGGGSGGGGHCVIVVVVRIGVVPVEEHKGSCAPAAFDERNPLCEWRLRRKRFFASCGYQTAHQVNYVSVLSDNRSVLRLAAASSITKRNSIYIGFRSTSISRGLQVETADLIQFSINCSNSNEGHHNSARPSLSQASPVAPGIGIGNGESNNNVKKTIKVNGDGKPVRYIETIEIIE
jgi:hypothetical protein